jgi:hypothetical protein
MIATVLFALVSADPVARLTVTPTATVTGGRIAVRLEIEADADVLPVVAPPEPTAPGLAVIEAQHVVRPTATPGRACTSRTWILSAGLPGTANLGGCTIHAGGAAPVTVAGHPVTITAPDHDTWRELVAPAPARPWPWWPYPAAAALLGGGWAVWRWSRR